ncbi:hypothetical protein AA313_de0203446 [Arthrobotrys entomopaga]|nr:hypothetical protein AA313_de0203446 [Arthrobotrys entomopaga]
MGLFRRRSNSSTTSSKLKRPQRSGALPPPEIPAIPPPPPQSSLSQNYSKPSFNGPGYFAQRDPQPIDRVSISQGDPYGNPHQRGPIVAPPIDDGLSTPVSQISGFTHPSDAAPARSTAPSSVDALSALSKMNGHPHPPSMMMQSRDGNRPQMQLNGQRISTSTMPDDGFYMNNDIPRLRSLTGGGMSVVGSEFDSKPSSMTMTAATGMVAGNRKPPPPPLRDNPSTSTLPQEWTDRDPSINTRFTHSPTPSESASMQSSVVYPQQPQPHRRHHNGYLPPGHHPSPYPPQNNNNNNHHNNHNNKFRPPPPHHYSHPLHHTQKPTGSRFQRPPLPPHLYRPHSANQRLPPRFLPPPLTPRGSYRGPPNMLPSLPENRRAQSLVSTSPSRPLVPPTPGPKSLALLFTTNHIECNNRHQILLPTKNYHHPVPCLTCRRVPSDGMLYCSFCSLRICRECARRLKKEWDGDITKGWGGVTPATDEFSIPPSSDAKMVAGWGDRCPPIRARNAVDQLVWPSKSNTERVCTLLGVPYRPKTAPSLTSSYQTSDAVPKTPDLIKHPSFNFDSNVDLESGPSTISPPSPVTPPAFGGSSSSHRLPLSLPNEHRLPIPLTNGKHPFDAPGYGYNSSPEILSDSNPELVQPRPYHPVDTANILNADARSRSHTFDYSNTMPLPPPPPMPATMQNGSGSLYRTSTAASVTTVGKTSTMRTATGSTRTGYDTPSKSTEKKKKGFLGLFSKK